MIHAYLRASTADQDASRAKDQLKAFAAEHGQRIASWHIENQSGTKLDRPELMRLIDNAEPGDVLLLEQVDRLTRLNAEDWDKLKRQVKDAGLLIVSTDLPTSWQQMNPQHDPNGFTGRMFSAINEMLLDMVAAISRKDWEDRKRRAAQGLAKAKAEGKLQGRKADTERHQQVIKYREKGLSLMDVANATGYSKAQVCKILKAHKEQQ